MATIHMNVDSCRNLGNTISSTQEQMLQCLTQLNSSVNGVVGSEWVAASATQFQSAFQEWGCSMAQLLDQLNTLNQRLQAEISEFEAAAAQLQ